MHEITRLRQPLARFPITKQLHEVIKQRRTKARPEFVSDSLIDDIVQRVSPYLLQNPPLDIVDFWPGAGLLSTKLNDLLKPRRHLLVEPNVLVADKFLKPLTQSNPCYKLINESMYDKTDWADFLVTHFPEQVPHNRQVSEALPKNDTLLVLANLPAASSRLDHFRPGRWWLGMLNNCLHQTGLNAYGSIRVLATSPFSDIAAVLPRSANERTRTGLLAETLGLHTIEIASPAGPEPSHQWRGWDIIHDNRKRVAQRTAATGIVTPPNREFPPLEPVPPVTGRGKKEAPYEPRVYLDVHKEMFKAIAAGDELGLSTIRETTDPKAQAIIKERQLAITKLARDNKAAYTRQRFANMRLKIDEVTRAFSRAATDPKETPESLKALDDEIISLKSTFDQELSSTHFILTRLHGQTVDDARLVFVSNNFDDSILAHDRRPFEPLYVEYEEIYPRAIPRGLIYFEADPNPPALKKIHDLPSALRPEVLERLFILMSIVGNRGTMSLTELFEILFPKRAINDLVRAIPPLATFAEKRLKPGCGPMPLPDGSTSDPVSSYQDNVDYDLREVRLRILSVSTLVDILMEYEKLPDKLSLMHFSRVLGGTMTMSQIGEEANNMRIR
ncbi:hypothetical protein N7457_005693 [Penicillium paradoxum]|uniref:uncharacterized protein n=1 Tax=Penicillium paradoxum TaxID=176176 RepID=UPI0025499C59|nr:uncharacterized protein N7457_005693 [Penicillium paradoxum]KAJ5780533.1 hypothetical protein N7457_005693 [Penicillium paradoxum]